MFWVLGLSFVGIVLQVLSFEDCFQFLLFFGFWGCCLCELCCEGSEGIVCLKCEYCVMLWVLGSGVVCVSCVFYCRFGSLRDVLDSWDVFGSWDVLDSGDVYILRFFASIVL